MSDPIENSAPQASKDNLRPPEIDFEKITDENEKKAAAMAIKEWLQEIQKEVSDILEKKGVHVFQLSVLHEGTKNPLVLWKGSIYGAAKIAKHAASALKSQVLEELSE
jgi:hypothetical protein